MPKCQICGEYTYLSPICKKCAKQIIVDETDAATKELQDILRERETDEPEYNGWSRANRSDT